MDLKTLKLWWSSSKNCILKVRECKYVAFTEFLSRSECNDSKKSLLFLVFMPKVLA